MTKVSVIIPVYNSEKYIHECLESIVNQTLKDIEIICIDDGSVDNSLNILKEYAQKDDRFTILTQQNKGAGIARTEGVKIAKGDYIGFVDSDDWIDLNYYETLYNKAVVENADIVRTTYKVTYADLVKESAFNKLINKKIKKKQYLSNSEHFGIIWNAIYKTDFLRSNKIDYFDIDLPMCHDVPYSTRVELLAQKIVPVNKTYYYYRKNREGQLTTFSLKRLRCTLKAFSLSTEFINSIKLPDDIYKKSYKHYMWLLDMFFKKALTAKGFNEQEQKEYLNSFVSILRAYKFNNYPIKVYYLLKGDYKSYIETKKSRMKYNMLKIKKYLNFEDEYTHLVITLFGIKIKLRTKKCPPPEKRELYLKH